VCDARDEVLPTCGIELRVALIYVESSTSEVLILCIVHTHSIRNQTLLYMVYTSLFHHHKSICLSSKIGSIHTTTSPVQVSRAMRHIRFRERSHSIGVQKQRPHVRVDEASNGNQIQEQRNGVEKTGATVVEYNSLVKLRASRNNDEVLATTQANHRTSHKPYKNESGSESNHIKQK
jgi:hypothetical protein